MKPTKTAVLRALSLVLSVLLLIPCLASCAGEADGKPTPTGTVTDTPTAEPTDEEEKRIPLDLPEADYEGAEYHVLEWSVNRAEVPSSYAPWEEIDVDEYDADVIGSAVYTRNSSVEERLGVVITKEYLCIDSGYLDRVYSNQATADEAFQLVTINSQHMPYLVQNNVLLDMNEYADTIFHFDRPWWVKDAVKSFALGDKLYVCSSEMLLRDKGATGCVFFNKDIVRDYGSLPNFYDLADNKEWTFEVMLSACADVAGSLDGDDLLNSSDDIWGIYSAIDGVYFLYTGFGERFAHIDDAGYIDYDYGSEETLVRMKEIFDDCMLRDWNAIKFVCGGGTLAKDVFTTGHCLFIPNMVKAADGYRDMTGNYGILPVPLYDESQTAYSSLVAMSYDSVLGIPLDPGDREMCAMVTEALSWESYYTVSPQFYDVLLMGRSTRDADSQRMLEVIFDTRVYDPGQYWAMGVGVLSLQGIVSAFYSLNSDMASMWQSFTEATDVWFAKINSWIETKE